MTLSFIYKHNEYFCCYSSLNKNAYSTFTVQEVLGVEGVPVFLGFEARGVKVLADHMQV